MQFQRKYTTYIKETLYKAQRSSCYADFLLQDTFSGHRAYYTALQKALRYKAVYPTRTKQRLMRIAILT